MIGPLSINTGPGPAVYIDGTNLSKSFVLSNLTIAGNDQQGSSGIVLNNINLNAAKYGQISAAVMGVQTSIQHDDVGIKLQNSNGVTLDGGGANPSGPGIKNTGAGTINHNLTGAIDLEQSSNVTVKGWQLSTNGPSGAPDWVGLDPGISHWGVGGVRLFHTTNSTIDHNAANNDTVVSFSLFGSSNDSVTSNTADYPFTSNVMVADGSQYDVIANNDFSTADFIGVLIADPLSGSSPATHNITVQNNIDHTDGPTGTEIKTNVVPAFNGGIVVLNGTYDNSIIGNQAFSNTGADLVWAQTQLQPSSPIGVAFYPPIIHCNVTVSEDNDGDGADGVAHLNGNVWTGNTARSPDSCIPPQ